MTPTLRDQMPPIGLGTWPLTGLDLAALQVELDAEDVARLGVLDRGESAARDVDAEEHF